MFSGIVQGRGTVKSIERSAGSLRLGVDLQHLADGLIRGASVSVSGVCLSATEIADGVAVFDVMGETLEKTTLSLLNVGDEINIERSLKMGDEIGGHRVSGHVAGVAEIIDIAQPDGNWIVKLRCNAAWMDFILPKGFIALDGCSLTIVDVGSDWFTVHLIPETLAVTTFGKKIIGDKVNLEIDPETQAIVETVKRHFTSVIAREGNPD